MKYHIEIYEPQTTSPDYRFSLGTLGQKPLFVFAVNPSTATDTKADMTVSKVMGFALRNGCDSFVIFNLYAQRTPYPDKLHKQLDRELHIKNLRCIQKAIEHNRNMLLLAAWGESIKERDYFKTCIRDIVDITKANEIQWLKIGELTKSGHPRHPSRCRYFCLTKFDIEKYIMTLK